MSNAVLSIKTPSSVSVQNYTRKTMPIARVTGNKRSRKGRDAERCGSNKIESAEWND